MVLRLMIPWSLRVPCRHAIPAWLAAYFRLASPTLAWESTSSAKFPSGEFQAWSGVQTLHADAPKTAEKGEPRRHEARRLERRCWSKIDQISAISANCTGIDQGTLGLRGVWGLWALSWN